jgi:hypothetical protein
MSARCSGASMAKVSSAATEEVSETAALRVPRAARRTPHRQEVRRSPAASWQPPGLRPVPFFSEDDSTSGPHGNWRREAHAFWASAARNLAGVWRTDIGRGELRGARCSEGFCILGQWVTVDSRLSRTCARFSRDFNPKFPERWRVGRLEGPMLPGLGRRECGCSGARCAHVLRRNCRPCRSSRPR